ncbi:MAG: hypothetical protein CM15mP9_0050 [Methanobacteriota archaeon]|nr:MAG: hypothetical protein CM15mP9_0050 [Euryarchaeota archaeon]
MKRENFKEGGAELAKKVGRLVFRCFRLAYAYMTRRLKDCGANIGKREEFLDPKSSGAEREHWHFIRGI